METKTKTVLIEQDNHIKMLFNKLWEDMDEELSDAWASPGELPERVMLMIDLDAEICEGKNRYQMVKRIREEENHYAETSDWLERNK